MRYRSIVIFLILVTATACGSGKTAGGNTASADSPNAKRFPFRGTIVSVDKTAKTAVVEHDAIEGFMEAMTMPFPIHDGWVWDDLAPGSQIQAELVVDNSAKDPYWLERLAISAAPNPNQQVPEILTPKQVGQDVPDIKLTDQDGKRFSLVDHRGKALAITFIYRECPLPDFCIKMSKNFSDAAISLAGDNAYRDKIRLVSISFDPKRDTPEKLRQYGVGYLGNPAKPDFSIWRLAVGSEKDVRSIADFFGLKYEVDETDKAIINHSLVTAVIGPDGKVKKIFADNRWTPAELVQSLKETLN